MRTGKSTFYDRKNFPHGFNRSGEFTIKESNLLSNYGRTMLSLSTGDDTPTNDTEQVFIEQITGQAPLALDYAKVWSKYLKVTKSTNRLVTLPGNNNNAANHRYDETAESLD